MERTPVNSSNIASVGYTRNPDTVGMGTLEVEFKNGAVYQYDDVPWETHDALLRAESAGSVFSHSVRGVFTGRRV